MPSHDEQPQDEDVEREVVTEAWRRPGCGFSCLPGNHNPIVHEQYGYEQWLNDATNPGVAGGRPT